MRIIRWLGMIALSLLITAAAWAQGTGASGEIRGTVTDPTGAVMPSVSVSATDVAKGTKRTTTTGSAGEYEFQGLPPSTYNVAVSQTGFQTQIQKGVVVSVGQTVIVDFRMKVSPTAEAVISIGICSTTEPA